MNYTWAASEGAFSALAEDMGVFIKVEGYKDGELSLSDKLSSNRRIKDKFSNGSVY